jgi:hypothetical protein
VTSPAPPWPPLIPRRAIAVLRRRDALVARAGYEAARTSDDVLIDAGRVAWSQHTGLLLLGAVNPDLARTAARALGYAS